MKARICNEKRNYKPWLEQSGKIKPDSLLKLISVNWDTRTWESFLVDTVDKAKPDREVMISNPKILIDIVDRARHSQMENSWSQVNPQLVDFLNCAIEKLIPQQQRVLKLLYWEGLSFAQAAEVLQVTKATIQTLKSRALCKLKSLMPVWSYEFHYLIEGQQNEVPRLKNLNEEILEVYRLDLKGHCHV